MASNRCFSAPLPYLARACTPASRALLRPAARGRPHLARAASAAFTTSSQQNQQQQQSPDPETPAAATAPRTPNILQQPHYELTFTCRPCGTRSRHRVSKQGYHRGSVLIACPTCRNRHVISDHLRIFGDTAMTVEDLLRERGELVKRGTLGEDGDLEFWEDGEVTPRQPWDDHDTSSSAAAAGV
ncbi:42859f66-800c-4ce3-b702-8bf99c47aac9 [Thermothielavioides terrestris]|uniref:42859f66-800c-4ce3-b702-8bf99c47aac9 n=1 Tax=Thermothielavioides terrestris TaxID=2587410 RepID=A0A3S4B0T5_9PEZI|nr:42859f66-800c-4ce3-b702-8bf99c47aac9 [Thermothielavioides terrestris]